MKKIAFLRTCSRPIPRILRMIHVANEIGLSSYFIGAYREKNLPRKDNWDGVLVKRVGIFYPLLNGKNILRYMVGVLVYNLASFFALIRDKPELIHVSDIESFPAGYFYRFLFRKKLVYNIHDNLSQRYHLPRFINILLNHFEGIVTRFSDVALVPEAFRLEALPSYCHKKITIIKNTPIDRGIKPPSINFGKKNINIFYAGWIDEGRGIKELLKLSYLLHEAKIMVAGEGDKKLIKQLEENNITYLGFLTHNEIMNQTEMADFVFAYYDPVRIINCYAAPNKVAEALSIGRPVIINKETLIANKIKEKDCGVIVGYSDTKQLAHELRGLMINRDQFFIKCNNARKLFEEEYLWETARATSKEVLKRLLNT